MLIRCKTGGEMIEVAEGQDPHGLLDATGCRHCLDSHGPEVHCGQAANACTDPETDTHDGPCWDGTGDRPAGCTVCRPILFLGNTTLSMGG